MLRATLKSLLSRKLRLVLSGLAVVLGVMFVSGAFVLTDTLGRSFDGLFATVYSDTDVQVTAVAARDGAAAHGEGSDGEGSEGRPVPADQLAKIRAVPGVASAAGIAEADGARVIGANGKVISNGGGPPRLGSNWTGESDLVQLREGRGPTAATEIAVNASLAKAAGIKVGDQVGVLTLQPKRVFTLVGVFGYSGGRDSLGGMQMVSFTEPVAQELMLGETGVYTHVTVRGAAGVSATKLRDDIKSALGDGYRARTGDEVQAETMADFREGLSFFNNILLGFAAVALFVGTFLILNTFSIIVAQRTRELALMRALGAGRRQVISAVLIEAAAIGLVASVVGLAAGIGVGAGLAWLFGNMSGSALELAGIGVPAAAVIGAFAVGVLTTVVAALLPALRASRIAPVAALQEAATPDRPLTRLTVAGLLIGAAGGTALGMGLTGQGDNTLYYVLGGVLVSFIGVALLTPAVARPVVHLLGRLFAWSVPGKLGRLNSGRNPRRTAITAAALMVGLALITGVNVILTSAEASLSKTVDKQLKADLVVSGEQNRHTFDAGVLDRAATLPGVARSAGMYVDDATVSGNGSIAGVTAATDVAALASMFSLTPVAGRLDSAGPDQLVLAAKDAKDLGVSVGGSLPLKLPKGGSRTTTVVGIYADNDLMGDSLVGPGAISALERQQPSWGFFQLRDGASIDEVRAQLDAMLVDSPEVTVSNRAEAVDQETAELDSVLMMIQILLALAILIAVLGVINTLALSVLERTRELGLLRAIGLRRAQTMRMVTVEAVVISVFGALLGLVVGSGLGAAVVRAMKDQGVTTLTFPWSSMAVYLTLAGLVGVVAAVLPAIRAARVNVLTAIAHE